LRYSSNHKTRQLVTLAKGGDASALDQLCRVYAERVRWMVRLRIGKELRSKLESMDLAQEVFIHALEGLGDFTYEDEGDFVRWLSKIAENAFRDNLDKLHAEKRDIRKELRLGGSGPTTGGRFAGAPGPIAATTPSAIMSKREDLARLEEAIDKLRPEYREVILLAKIEELSYSQIGDRLGKSAGAVKMLVSRAIVALASTFEGV
jgi:RNA polymerase sigma-70 factor (ECF subfamily)